MSEGRGVGRPLSYVLLLFATATFASAFLLFLVQPLVGKRILPWFGGAPAVWTLCLAYYQTTLFAGYAYAHALIRFARPGQQLVFHALAVAAALAVLPVLPDESWRPVAGSAPSARILAMLATNVGPPFLVLAATGPLLQAWFARSLPGHSPYPLFAVSNLGSLLAVLAYPFWVEPSLGVTATGSVWSAAFALTAVAVLACAAQAWRSEGPDPAGAAEAEAGDRPGVADALLWMALAGSAVMLLMGVTNELCLDVASVPFLWMLPLCAYLLSFVLCFGYERSYSRSRYLILTVAALAVPTLVSLLALDGPRFGSASRDFFLQTLRYCLLLFGGCMLLHGELYRLRPAPTSLTSYYLYVAAGGALGGLFVGIGAPALFDDYHERPLALALGWLALLAAVAREPSDWLGSRAPRGQKALVALGTVAVLGYGANVALAIDPSVVHRERNFFGLLRVLEVEADGTVVRAMAHGTTRHGYQISGREDEPSSYFGVHTGIGRVFESRRQDAASRVGVIGLGIGTLAAYGRPGDDFSFFEIDPAVERVAGTHFSYLESSEANVEIVRGDGRLSLEAEQRAGARHFDLLVLDAYSGDAVPVHLMTREALALYADRVAEDGLIAFHLSSRHFDLAPLVGRLAAAEGLHAMVLDSPHLPRELSVRTIWVIVSRSMLGLLELAQEADRHWRGLGVEPGRFWIEYLDPEELSDVPLWTDDYSDLLSVLGRPGADRIRPDRPPAP